MRCFLFCFILTASLFSHANDDEAIRMAFEAFSKTRPAQTIKNKIENKVEDIINKIGFVGKKTTGIILVSTIILSNGEVSTRDLKTLKFQQFGGIIKPEITYNFNKGTTESLLITTWHF